MQPKKKKITDKINKLIKKTRNNKMIWVIIQKFLTGFPMGKKAVPGLGLQAEVGEWCPEESEGLKGNQ